MKICFINPTIEMRRSIAELACKMADSGHEVAMVWPRFRNKSLDMSRHFTSMLKHKNIKIIDIPCFQIPGLFYSWPIPAGHGFVKKLKKIMQEYDIIHMWTYFYLINVTPLILRKSRKYKAKVVVTADTFPAFSFQDPSPVTNSALYVYAKLFGRSIFKAYDKVLIYGNSVIKHALRAGVKKSNLKVLKIGVDTSKFVIKDKKKVEKARKELGADSNTVLILFVGLLNPRKGVDVVIKVTNNLIKKGLKVKTLVVGEEKQKKYENMTKKLGLQKDVLFLGRRKDIPMLMNAADLLMLPAKGEGLPGVVMEAASASTPAVASNIPCIPDLVIDGKSGYLCEIDNIKQFTQAAEKLVKSKALREKFGKAAFKHIQKYDWKRVIKKYEQFYGELLSKE